MMKVYFELPRTAWKHASFFVKCMQLWPLLYRRQLPNIGLCRNISHIQVFIKKYWSSPELAREPSCLCGLCDSPPQLCQDNVLEPCFVDYYTITDLVQIKQIKFAIISFILARFLRFWSAVLKTSIRCLKKPDWLFVLTDSSLPAVQH